MTDTKKLSMSELIALHNTIADKLGIAHETAFKNLAAARDAVANLEKKMDQATNIPTDPAMQDAPFDTTPVPTTAPAPTTASKYSSTGKRGPTQGVGEYAKRLIVESRDNAAVLAAVMIKFPSAKTSKGCIAFYRTALGKTPVAPDPGALRVQAQALLDKAADAERAIADAAAGVADKAIADAAGVAITQTVEEPATV